MLTEDFQTSHDIRSRDSYLLNTKLPFPIKLHDMLAEVVTVGDQSIVSWQPHGRAFRVHQPKAFAITVMPRYFQQQKKYKSFQRQLHIYGFHRIRKGVDKGAYFHTMFIRNQKSMSLRMSCQKIKGKKSTEAVDHHAAGDPDFYSSETKVDGNLPSILQSDPILQVGTTCSKENHNRGCLKDSQATAFITGCIDYLPDKATPLLNIAPLLFNQKDPGAAGPFPSDQLIAWMEQAEPFLSCEDAEQASPCDDDVNNVKLPFPIKLHDMLEEMAAVGDESIVSWQPHGKAFRVHNPDKFASTVMPRYFQHQKKYKSFQRQLHIYGFHRIRKGMDTGAYFHTMFIRNQKSMSLRMSCQKIKGKNPSKAVNHHAAGDPDFYSSEIKVDNYLTNVLQADPILQGSTTRTKENKMSEQASNRGPAALCTTTGSCFQHNDEEEKVFLKNPLPAGAVPLYQPDWLYEQDQILFQCVEEQPPPHHGADNSALEKGHAVLARLGGVNHQKYDDNEGFFRGNRFFDIVETKTPMTHDFSAVVNKRGPMFYMPRCA